LKITHKHIAKWLNGKASQKGCPKQPVNINTLLKGISTIRKKQLTIKYC